MELVELKNIPGPVKVELLRQLGFAVDKQGYVVRDGRRVVDKYVGKEVTMSNMDIMPDDSGRAVVLDHNILSLVSYMEEYGEV